MGRLQRAYWIGGGNGPGREDLHGNNKSIQNVVDRKRKKSQERK